MQAVCDNRRRILDLFIGYPGSVHDSRVFRNSPLGNNLEEKCRRYHLLADSGYPLKANILTPYKDRGNLTERQLNYNVKLNSNRYVIEHCFGMLKQKFRQLYHVKLRSIPYIVHLIRAACVLHNVSIEDEFAPNLNDINLEENIIQHEVDDEDEEDADARRIRDIIANTLQF